MNGPQGLEKTGGIGNQRKNRHYIDDSIVKIGSNIKEIPGNINRRACFHRNFSEGLPVEAGKRLIPIAIGALRTTHKGLERGR